MANRRLTPPEIADLNDLQLRTVADLARLAGGDPELLFALRRRLFTRLMHLERGTPAHRTKLKAEKWEEQKRACAICGKPLERKGSELDRLVASKGYTKENTRLVHHDCHIRDQRRKGFSDQEVSAAEQASDMEAARDECEMKVGDRWIELEIEEAFSLEPGTPMRCPACHGPVRPHKLGTTGQRAHFEHLKAHSGCPLKWGFAGEISPHPDARV